MSQAKNHIVIPKEAEILVVSDIHIRKEDDSKAKLFLALLDSATTSPQLKKIILLGDIFDFFFGDKIYFYLKFKKIFDALQIVSTSGKEIFFFEGNHEFSLSSKHLNLKTNFRIIPDGSLALTLASGTKILFSHGDLVFFDRSYENFRNFVKSRTVRKLANLIPASLLDGYALFHANHSRAHEKKLDVEALFHSAHEWLTSNQIPKGIIGHFHHEIKHIYADKLELYCMKSWDEPSFLSIDSLGNIKHHYI